MHARTSLEGSIRSHHIRWIAIVLGYIERSYDDLGPYKSRVYNLNSTIMTDPYMVLESERAYELLAGYGYCWVHTVPRCCYPACRSIGTLPAGPSLKVGYILTDLGDHAEGPLLWILISHTDSGPHFYGSYLCRIATRT